MSTVTKSVTVPLHEKKALENLIRVFTQSGPEDRSHWAPIIVQMMRDNPQWTKIKEGRTLLSVCGPNLSAEYVKILLYKNQSQDFARIDELLKAYFENLYSKREPPPFGQQEIIRPNWH